MKYTTKWAQKASYNELVQAASKDELNLLSGLSNRKTETIRAAVIAAIEQKERRRERKTINWAPVKVGVGFGVITFLIGLILYLFEVNISLEYHAYLWSLPMFVLLVTVLVSIAMEKISESK